MMRANSRREAVVIEFLAANWLWIAAIVVMVLMHRGGHGCGMHGSHGHRQSQRSEAGADHAAGHDSSHQTESEQTR
jgi:hypothetical protein